MLNVLFVLLLVVEPPQGNVGTGIFLTIECRKDIPRKHEMLTTRPVCITQSPIIYPKDFSAVGPVRDAGANVYFELTFTPKGHQTLIKLTASLPRSELALVVNDDVFFVFKAAELKVASTFRFQTSAKYRAQVEAVQRQLVEIMGSASR